MESIYDTNNLFDKLASNDLNEDDKKDFFELWDKEQSKYLRSILLIFSVSHIIIVSLFKFIFKTKIIIIE
jgi:hypothetical protein